MFTRSIALRLTRCSSCATPRVAYRPSHQRRPSSSKASVPPNGASRGRSSAPSGQEGSSSSGRSRGKKAKLFASDREFANLPAVPPTHHLGLENISVSSFFSLHRPISVTTSIPPESTNDSFASIFESRAASRRSQLPKMVQPIGSDELAFDQEDVFAAPPEEAAPPATQGDDKFIYSRASVPKDVGTGARFAQDLQPFSPPPPPQPLHRRAMLRSMRRGQGASRGVAGPARRRVMARLFIEIVIPSDELEFLRSSRAVGFLMPQANGEHGVEQLDFVRRREILQALSVKRQRKLKMKKHKYKKLMKRTRNLRRRLGRL